MTNRFRQLVCSPPLRGLVPYDHEHDQCCGKNPVRIHDHYQRPGLQLVNDDVMGGVSAGNFGANQWRGGVSWRAVAGEQRRLRLRAFAALAP